MFCRSDRKLSRGVGVGLHPDNIGQARVSDADAGDRPQQHAQPRRDRQTRGERDRRTVTAGPSGAGFGTALRCRRALSTSYSQYLSSAAHASATGGAESGVWAAPAEGEGAAGRHQLDAALSGRSAPEGRPRCLPPRPHARAAAPARRARRGHPRQRHAPRVPRGAPGLGAQPPWPARALINRLLCVAWAPRGTNVRPIAGSSLPVRSRAVGSAGCSGGLGPPE